MKRILGATALTGLTRAACLALAGLALTSLALSHPASAQEKLKIGLVLSLSGDHSLPQS